LKRLSQRYLLATLAFVLAAIYTGLGLLSGLECLIAFSFVYAIAGAAQRGMAQAVGDRGRDSSPSRSRRTRARPSRREPSRERSGSRHVDVYDRPREPSRRPAGTVYDLDRHSVTDEWPQVADRVW
jgi:hypothetical protein